MSRWACEVSSVASHAPRRALIHLDTSFLVDLLRETRRRAPGSAHALLEDLEQERLWISLHVACELYAGVELSPDPEGERTNVAALIAGLQVAYPDRRFAPTYGRLLGNLERVGERIAAVDLLIATTAVVEGAVLVTRNVRDFERAPGLRIQTY